MEALIKFYGLHAQPEKLDDEAFYRVWGELEFALNYEAVRQENVLRKVIGEALGTK